MRSRKLFVGVMACITAIIVTVLVDNNNDFAESAIQEEMNLLVSESSLITTENFDTLKYEIEAKLTETEEDKEVTEELTTEMITEPVTEQPTEVQVNKNKQKTAKKRDSAKTEDFKPKEIVAENAQPATEVQSNESISESDSESTESTESVESTESTEEPATEAPKKSMYYNMSDDDIYTLAALIYLEAGSTSYKCQCAVGSVVLNLMIKEGKTLHQCIKTPGRFSVANRVYRTKPSSTSLEAARSIVTNGPTLPSYVSCFRNNHYFSWATPYCNIDNVYFSY